MFCRRCGHNLADARSGRCPQCRQEFDYAHPLTYAPTLGAYRAGKFAKKATTAFLILGALTACYVGDYTLLVVPRPPGATSGIPPWGMYPYYRFGGDTSAWIFQPLVIADQWLFPRRWEDWEMPDDLVDVIRQSRSWWTSYGNDPNLGPRWNHLHQSIDDAEVANDRVKLVNPADQSREAQKARRESDRRIREARNAEEEFRRAAERNH